MHDSRVSVIGGHARDQKTDYHYQPLRKFLLQDTTAKKQLVLRASRASHVSHVPRLHTFNQNRQIGEMTFIPEYKKLKQTNDFSKMPDKNRFCVVDAFQKQYAPISESEFKRRYHGKQQQEVVLYTYGSDSEIKFEQQQPTKLVQPSVMEGSLPPRRKSFGIKVTQPKYNLFSMIDQPLNNLLNGNPCTCPANQLIASKRNQIKWNQGQNQ